MRLKKKWRKGGRREASDEVDNDGKYTFQGGDHARITLRYEDEDY